MYHTTWELAFLLSSSTTSCDTQQPRNERKAFRNSYLQSILRHKLKQIKRFIEDRYTALSAPNMRGFLQQPSHKRHQSLEDSTHPSESRPSHRAAEYVFGAQPSERLGSDGTWS
ncbi:hypothetical protein BU23DRAFT_273158 [Bimuria novae-zelandiae CBS 107.79]|uniref:Uncharacterized protein n=1 Tax=Bimuria novae-zelandiae CBS 107.79 TaxID=1447943 RepID=A0A6A5VX81_9PLEO|nr:hypothetical protein BU23DRAFT_273158 [Bimuria novae-zelandiae CBS 107.79]